MLKMQTLWFSKICAIVLIVDSMRLASTQNVDDDCVMNGSGAAGTCVLLQNCPYAIMHIVNKAQYPTHCGFQNADQIVCCPKMTTPRPTLPPVGSMRISAQKCVEYQEPVYEKISVSVGFNREPINRKILRCPIANVPLIVGGEAAKPKEFPHMALIGYGGPSANETRWLCGGSLISEQYVLTAAHCIYTKSTGFAQYVRLGELIISSTTDDSRPIDLNIIERILHHDYKIPSKYNDIALLKLEHPVTFSQYVRPACLAETFDIPSKTVIATGWGRTEYAEMTSDHLQKVVLDQIVQPSCNASYAPHLSRNLRRGIVEETQFCAGSKLHRDTCQGDSGGPIQIRHSSISCMYTVVGITSFGIRCAETSLPGVYTRVYPYIDWIESIVWPQ